MLCFTKMYPKLPMQLSLIFSNTISLFHPVFSDLLICSFFTYCNENVPLGLIVTRFIICHYYLPWFEFSAITGSDNFYCHISTSFFKWIRFRHFQIGANMVYLTDKKSASHIMSWSTGAKLIRIQQQKVNILDNPRSIAPQNYKYLSQGILHLWSKLGDLSLDEPWVIAQTISW